ncbi:MAG: response regulator [Clostridia bacterium]|nr:response regulator [Clostridia bacterium]
MRKGLIILGNVLIVLAILTFVVLYAGNEQRRLLASRTDAFENMTVAMEHVTTNYLVGEQRVCDSWANHINATGMTGQEAIDFVRTSVTSPSIMVHLLYTDGDTLAGYTTTAASGRPEDFTVSYGRINLFPQGVDAFFNAGNTVNVTRAYTNPVNAVQSIAFCRPVTLTEADGQTRPAVLLRIIPVSVFVEEWVFPTDEYEEAEISLLDDNGDYIISGRSFTNSNFFEFYQSYNQTAPDTRERLHSELAGASGSLEMNNSRGERCVIAHTRVNSTDDWLIVTLIPLSSLGRFTMDWHLVGIIAGGLLLLLLLDFLIMLQFNRRLKVAADAAEQANRAKTDFLSTMSHDIRTPMNAIIGLTTIAGRNVEDPATVRESLHKINLASNHLLTLINDILDISKVESGKLNLSPVTFSLAECAENLVNISQPMVKEKNIDFNFRISRIEHEYLYADQLRINQIFINLLSNAIKYTEPRGRVCVDLREEPGTAPDRVKLTYVVADTGMGMSPEFMERMYQPFSRQTDSRVNTIQGTGLGLAITKQMVDLMHGTIDCRSALGEGTTFTVVLEIPIADRKTEQMTLPEGTRVLIADDDPVLLETAMDTLQSLGARAQAVGTSAGAVEQAVRAKEQGDPFQVVILDWKMPDMDGIRAAEQIRSAVGPEVPILLISAYDQSDLEEAAQQAGISGFISKPLFRSTLYDKISELLGQAREHADQEEDDTDIAGMNILVAEDNDINWEIISMLLQMHGITSERAENGQLAVDRMARAREGEFNLIFMDIQMPVLNGIDATRAIRALPDPRAAGIPIIAMTADAFSENIAECLAAGMNGHIAKPIDMKLVLKELRRIRESEKRKEGFAP